MAVFVFGLFKMAFGNNQSAGPFMGMGATLFFFFAIVRLIQRRRWMRACTSTEAMHQAVAVRLLSGPVGGFWRTWMHLNVDGGDRDRTD